MAKHAGIDTQILASAHSHVSIATIMAMCITVNLQSAVKHLQPRSALV